MSSQPTWIPGPSPAPRGGGMVPAFGDRHQMEIEPAPVDEQKILCVDCLITGNYAPPQQIVILSTGSHCVSHARGRMGV